MLTSAGAGEVDFTTTVARVVLSTLFVEELVEFPGTGGDVRATRTLEGAAIGDVSVVHPLGEEVPAVAAAIEDVSCEGVELFVEGRCRDDLYYGCSLDLIRDGRVRPDMAKALDGAGVDDEKELLPLRHPSTKEGVNDADEGRGTDRSLAIQQADVVTREEDVIGAFDRQAGEMDGIPADFLVRDDGAEYLQGIGSYRSVVTRHDSLFLVAR
jgi:hypothetical protein